MHLLHSHNVSNFYLPVFLFKLLAFLKGMGLIVLKNVILSYSERAGATRKMTEQASSRLPNKCICRECYIARTCETMIPNNIKCNVGLRHRTRALKPILKLISNSLLHNRLITSSWNIIEVELKTFWMKWNHH